MWFIFIAACSFSPRHAYAVSLATYLVDAAFGREQSNSTGGTYTRVDASFTGAPIKLSDGCKPFAAAPGWK